MGSVVYHVHSTTEAVVAGGIGAVGWPTITGDNRQAWGINWYHSKLSNDSFKGSRMMLHPVRHIQTVHIVKKNTYYVNVLQKYPENF